MCHRGGFLTQNPHQTGLHRWLPQKCSISAFTPWRSTSDTDSKMISPFSSISATSLVLAPNVRVQRHLMIPRRVVGYLYNL